MPMKKYKPMRLENALKLPPYQALREIVSYGHNTRKFISQSKYKDRTEREILEPLVKRGFSSGIIKPFFIAKKIHDKTKRLRYCDRAYYIHAVRGSHKAKKDMMPEDVQELILFHDAYEETQKVDKKRKEKYASSRDRIFKSLGKQLEHDLNKKSIKRMAPDKKVSRLMHSPSIQNSILTFCKTYQSRLAGLRNKKNMQYYQARDIITRELGSDFDLMIQVMTRHDKETYDQYLSRLLDGKRYGERKSKLTEYQKLVIAISKLYDGIDNIKTQRNLYPEKHIEFFDKRYKLLEKLVTHKKWLEPKNYDGITLSALNPAISMATVGIDEIKRNLSEHIDSDYEYDLEFDDEGYFKGFRERLHKWMQMKAQLERMHKKYKHR